MDSVFYVLLHTLLFLTISITPGVFYPKTFDPFELPKLVLIRASLGLFFLIALLYRRNPKINRSTLLTPMLSLAVVTVISTLLSQYRWISFYGEWERYLGLSSMLPMIFAGIAMIFIDHKKIPLLKYALSLGLIFVIIRSLRQILGYEIIPIDIFSGRLSASLGNPDFLGEYLVMVIPIPMLEAIYSKKRIWKVVNLVIFSLAFLALLLSGTRGSWLAFLILLILMPIVFVKPKTPLSVYHKVILYVSLTGVIVAMLLYLPVTLYIRLTLLALLIIWLYLYIRHLYPYMIEEVKLHKISIVTIAIIIIVSYISLPHITSLIPYKGDLVSESLRNRLSAITKVETGRWYIWKSVIRFVREEMIKNPTRLLFGYGLDTLGKYLLRYKDIGLARVDRIESITYPDRAHNEYLDIFLQTGLLGLLSFLLLLEETIKKGIEIHRSDHPYRLFSTELTLGVIGFVVNGLVIFGISVTYLYLFLMCGIIGIIYTPKGKLWKIRRDILYRVISIVILLFSIYTTYTGWRQLQAHKFLLKGVDAMDRGDLGKGEEYIDRSIRFHPIGYAYQKKLEIYHLKLRKEKSKEAFNRCIGLYHPLIEYVKYPTSVYYMMASVYMEGYELKLDKSMLDKVIFYLKECIKYDRYHKPSLRVLAKIYVDYLKDPRSAYQYAKRYIEIEQRDIELWRILMRTSKEVNDWDTVWFSAKAIYLATEERDKEAEGYLKEAEKHINPSKSP